MAQAIYAVLSEAVLFIETVEHLSDVRAGLTSAHYNDALHQKGKAAVRGAMEVIHQAGELQNDSSAVHLVHIAATEVEMWLQASRSRLLRGTSDASIAETVTGVDLHFHDHPVSVMAQAARLIAVLRNDTELRAQVGSERVVEDVLQRGFALLQKLVRVAEDFVHPEQTEVDGLFTPAVATLDTWISEAHGVARRAHGESPRRLGLLGVLTDDPLPLGGAAGRVTRHQNAQRPAPTGGPSANAPGWTLGRQGRNAENRGKGYDRP
jgi:hypothetical protein